MDGFAEGAHCRHHFIVAPTSRIAPSMAAEPAAASPSLSGAGRLARIEWMRPSEASLTGTWSVAYA